MIHLVRLVINRPDIPVHLLRCIRHAIHNPFHITFHRRNRCFQIMGNITDQFLILFVQNNFFLCIGLEALSHLLKILAKLRKLIIAFHLKLKIKIAFLNIFRGILQFHKWRSNAAVNPGTNQKTGKYQNGHNHKYNIFCHQFGSGFLIHRIYNRDVVVFS